MFPMSVNGSTIFFIRVHCSIVTVTVATQPQRKKTYLIFANCSLQFAADSKNFYRKVFLAVKIYQFFHVVEIRYNNISKQLCIHIQKRGKFKSVRILTP
jgi:hypothetical protein